MAEPKSQDPYLLYVERWRATPLDVRPRALRRAEFTTSLHEYADLSANLRPLEPGEPPTPTHSRAELLRLLLLL
jgi:hypothetical protein